MTPVTQFTKPVLILLNALAPAIQKDFPDLKLTRNALIQKTIKALKELDDDRKTDFEDTEYFIEKSLKKAYKTIQFEESKIKIYRKFQEDFIKKIAEEIIHTLKTEKSMNLCSVRKENLGNSNLNCWNLQKYFRKIFPGGSTSQKSNLEAFLIHNHTFYKYKHEFKTLMLSQGDVLRIVELTFKSKILIATECENFAKGRPHIAGNGSNP